MPRYSLGLLPTDYYSQGPYGGDQLRVSVVHVDVNLDHVRYELGLRTTPAQQALLTFVQGSVRRPGRRAAGAPARNA